jgi:3-oxoacyl-[acyl-carrier-protein] synthase-1
LHTKICIVDYDLVCAAGVGLPAVRAALALQQTGLKPNDFPECTLDTYIGRVTALDGYVWPEADKDWESRNNALIELALQQGSLLASLARVRDKVGAARIGLVMGSSTSSIDRAEAAYRVQRDKGEVADEYLRLKVLNPHAPAFYTAHRTGITGPSVTLSTACSSSAKVFATAARWLNTGVVDAVLVGGADSLCLTVLYGFHSLQLVANKLCSPFDQFRDGINLGEGAGFALLTREDLAPEGTEIVLSGYGESSDAHHMSHPHPEGEGARLAMQQALAMAKLQPEQIDYVNLHGTSSRVNDLVEGNLMAQVFPTSTPMSSTKGWTGHTLGAAGIVEAIIAMDTFRTGLLPGNLHCKNADPEIALQLSEANRAASPRHVMSNSFGFGGNNASLIFSRAH